MVIGDPRESQHKQYTNASALSKTVNEQASTKNTQGQMRSSTISQPLGGLSK